MAKAFLAEIAAAKQRQFRSHGHGTGYVVDSLEAALWAFHASNTFRDGLLLYQPGLS